MCVIVMPEFITEEKLSQFINEYTMKSSLKKTKRNGTSINLRGIIYQCIRATYYEIIDTEPKFLVAPEYVPGFTFMSSVGEGIHERLQDILGLKKFPYTEKLMKFKVAEFSPLTITTKSDGIDTDNGIFYEIKTKSDIPNKPYDDELAQNICGAWLFSKELQLPILGSTMIYFSRNLVDYKIFNYDLVDENSENYLNWQPIVIKFINKIDIIRKSLEVQLPPPMDSEYVKTRAYGKDNCATCPYSWKCGVEMPF